MLPGLPGACLLWDGVGVCAACMPGLALRWPAGVWACVRVCVWLPGLPGLRDLLPPGKIPGFPRPGLSGPFLRPGGAGSGWIVGRACCRCWPPGAAAYAVVYACIVREGMPGALWRAFWLAACCGSFAGQPWKTRKFYRKIPRKNAHKKFFQNISPYGGTVCTRKIFAKRGLTTTRSRDIFQAQQATRHRDA